MLREDISAAMETLPDNVRSELRAQLEGPLALVNANLPRDEQVLTLSSAAPSWSGTPRANSVLALTERRLIFVSPTPQVIAWSLRTITKAQVVTTLGTNSIGGYLIDGDEGSFQLGVDKAWGPDFGARVSFACAVAKIRNFS